MLVVKRVEVSTFSLVWEFGSIADHITVVVIPSVIIVSLKSFFLIEGVYEDIVFTSIFLKFRKTFNMLWGVIEASVDNESLIGVFSAVGES